MLFVPGVELEEALERLFMGCRDRTLILISTLLVGVV